MAAFLDNSNDIILDAVLTDYGRQLLAKGDGSFNIVKFAFGDDEIDYGLYDATATSPNQDTEIMSSVILEAFTNNAASMKSKLLTIPDNNLLFLPVLKLNTVYATTTNLVNGEDYFIVPVDENSLVKATTNSLTGSADSLPIQGVLTISPSRMIVVDQGLNSSKTDSQKSLKNSPLYETEYNIKIDSRLGNISGLGNPISVDDDLEATYKIVDSATGTPSFEQISTQELPNTETPIQGTKGSRIKFSVEPSIGLQNTDTLFDRLGSSGQTLNSEDSSKQFKIIRTSITVEGVTTGYSIEIPIIFAKLQ